MKFKTLLPLLVILIVLLSLGFVSANEEVSIDNSLEENFILGSSEPLTSNYDNNSFSALNDLIQTLGNEITLEHNYEYNNDTDYAFVGGINITKNLVINGNNYIVDGYEFCSYILCFRRNHLKY